MRPFAETAEGCPRTVSPATAEPDIDPDAFLPRVDATAWPSTRSAVISPPNSETPCAWPVALAVAVAPTSLWAEAVSAPVVAIDPSEGYVKPWPNETWYGGAETVPVCAPDWPGTTT